MRSWTWKKNPSKLSITSISKYEDSRDPNVLVGLSDLDDVLSLSHRNILEIQGPAASGKTHLLYHMVMNCITPHTHTSINFDGKGMAAVIFDVDSSFSVWRLRQLLHARLCKASPTSSPDEISDLIDESLRRLHIFRPTSSTQLATSIVHLPSYHNAFIPNEEIGILAVDSISSFYWPDRLTIEHTRNTFPLKNQKGASILTSPFRPVLEAIQQFRSSHNATVVLTTWGLNVDASPPPGAGMPTLYKRLLRPFVDFAQVEQSAAQNSLARYDLSPSFLPLTYHITLSPIHILPSLHDTSPYEAQTQQNSHQFAGHGQALAVIQSQNGTKPPRALCIGDNEVSFRPSIALNRDLTFDPSP
ncbi:hypothetical protein BJ138DRAFT_854500 [Hygrophoropsis aurantiaca]|uniref:Uncharacterized protein n=1 Tax=Hygrophoropsis aurantiaca TaxID=72124 RepID=A0ACB8AFK7_9AGAM|nr:hypothetical protein BJ138DRAFT_854500 [Hygrophoropsis aurantiaca]